MKNMLKLDSAIKPLISWDGQSEPKFAGTGFFVEFENTVFLITAQHVASVAPLWIFIPPEKRDFSWEDCLLRTYTIYESRSNDICVLSFKGFNPEAVLNVAKDLEFRNVQVGTMEYARFSISNERIVSPNPSHRFGHVTRVFLGDVFFPDESLELSFPALRGSSGAPIMLTTPPYSVIGVIRSNVQYELLPVEIYSELTDDNRHLSETKFYIPQGIAVGRNALLHSLREAKLILDANSEAL